MSTQVRKQAEAAGINTWMLLCSHIVTSHKHSHSVHWRSRVPFCILWSLSNRLNKCPYLGISN